MKILFPELELTTEQEKVCADAVSIYKKVSVGDYSGLVSEIEEKSGFPVDWKRFLVGCFQRFD